MEQTQVSHSQSSVTNGSGGMIQVPGPHLLTLRLLWSPCECVVFENIQGGLMLINVRDQELTSFVMKSQMMNVLDFDGPLVLAAFTQWLL